MTELRFVLAYVRANLSVALEYRFAFWGNVLSMFLNDMMWVGFWVIFFSRFPAVRGYDLRDVMTIWAVAALGFGIAAGIFGNCHQYAALIAEGRLDFYLLLPRPVMLHVLVSRMSITAWGDAAFGLLLYAVVVRPTPLELAGFLVVALAAGAIMASYLSLANALAFWFGQAEGLAYQLMNALLVFSTYPTTLFSGLVRVVLFTAMPAGFIAYVPVRFLREWEPWQLGVMIVAAAAFTGLAVGVFRLGLRRYESGNLVAMRT